MILPEVFTAGLGQLRDCLGLSEEGRSWISKPTSCAWGYHKTGRTACDPARPTSHSPATTTAPTAASNDRRAPLVENRDPETAPAIALPSTAAGIADQRQAHGQNCRPPLLRGLRARHSPSSPEESDVVVDHRVRADRNPSGIRLTKSAEDNLVPPDLAQKSENTSIVSCSPGNAGSRSRTVRTQHNRTPVAVCRRRRRTPCRSRCWLSLSCVRR